MASSKRASMREGPLAALFRKTEEGEEAAAEARAAGADAAREPGAENTAAAREPRADASVAAPETPAEQAPRREEPRAEAPAPASEHDQAEPPPHPRETGYPHPALRSQEEPVVEEPHIATPQERLRHAFSSEIPDDIMAGPSRRQREPEPEPPAAPPAPLPIAPQRDPFARGDEPSTFGVARPVGSPVLRVVGVGGAGVNAVNRMVEAEVEGVEFVAINTDLQSLQTSTADITVHIGAQLTRGLGSGSNPDLGRQAAMDEYDKIKSLLKGSDMVFITAGAGGGTGTGAAPIVARIAKELGALTVGIVTKPFGFEGSRRREQADTGIQALSDEVDTLIVVPNNRLLSVLDKATSMVDAFRVADDVLRQGVQGISDLVTLPGLINLDFADVRTIMSDAGNALLGIGMGVGEHRAIEAAQQAVSSPLLETSMEGARKILLSITAGKDLSLFEVNDAAKAVSEAAHPDANIIFGAMVDDKLDDQVWVTVVATGYGERPARRQERRPEEQRRQLREPAGELRVERRREPEPEPRVEPRREPEPEAEPVPAARPRRTGLGVSELDVPEFIPRG